MSGLKTGFGKYMKKVEHEAELQSKVVMNLVLKKAKSFTPVRTGFLKKSWKLIKHKRLHWSIVNDAPYAAYVESGTPRFSGRHMLKKALAQTKGIRMGEKAAFGAAAAARKKK